MLQMKACYNGFKVAGLERYLKGIHTIVLQKEKQVLCILQAFIKVEAFD